MSCDNGENSTDKVSNLRNVYESKFRPMQTQMPYRTIENPVTQTTNNNKNNNSINYLRVPSFVRSNDVESENSDVDAMDDNSESDNLSKPECISQECINYIEQVNRCLNNLMYFKEELDKEYNSDSDAYKGLSTVFRDVQSLKSAYTIIIETIIKIKNKKTGFYLYEILLDSVVSNLLKMYKPFLNQYEMNAKWMGNFYRDNESCRNACNRARQSYNMADNVNMENCFYTVFNSLFSLGLMFDRYRNCFDERSVHNEKAEDAKNVISSLLSSINTSQDQIGFMTTHSELNLITGKSEKPKINTRFIMKDIVTKYARRDDKPLSRQLVLFSDILYVTLLPGPISGTSASRQELSIDAMDLSEIWQEDRSVYKWGLSISAKEAVQDFYFESEGTRKKWKDKLQEIIKDSINCNNIESLNRRSAICSVMIDDNLLSLGTKAPRWQKDTAASYCNGSTCTQKFNATIRRHHCRADGLLYCDSCCNRKLQLEFDPSRDSRVCQLCFNILSSYQNNPKVLEDAKKQLKAVIDKKNHVGKKTGWLRVKKFNKDKQTFLPEVNYYCVMDYKDPFLSLHEKHEDKIRFDGIMLLEMDIRTAREGSNYCKLISPNQFTIEHSDLTRPIYLMKASNHEESKKWVDCLRESIRSTFDS